MDMCMSYTLHYAVGLCTVEGRQRSINASFIKQKRRRSKYDIALG